jgi:hypothetical protein
MSGPRSAGTGIRWRRSPRHEADAHDTHGWPPASEVPCVFANLRRSLAARRICSGAASHMDRFVRLIHFHLAPCAVETRLRHRIEAALADHLSEAGDVVGAFQSDCELHIVEGEPSNERLDLTV